MLSSTDFAYNQMNKLIPVVHPLVKSKLIAFVTLLYFSINFLQAQTNVSGNITTNTTWTKIGSPYIMNGNIGVSSSATLTIEAGVEVIRNQDFYILINGSINAIGTTTDSIKFSSNISSPTAFFLDFQKSNLSNSTLKYFTFKNLSSANVNMIRVGNEAEGQEVNPKNSGILEISNSRFSKSIAVTKGYGTTASFVIKNSTIESSQIKGMYPRTEPITIENCTINNSEINSDSYNAGITIKTSIATKTIFKLGCCGANYTLDRTKFIDCQFMGGDGSPQSGPLNFTKCLLLNTYINLGSATVNISNTIINTSKSISGITDALIYIGNGNISTSSFLSPNIYCIKISGLAGYNIGGSNTINNTLFSNSKSGIRIENINTLSILNSDFVKIENYLIYNNSNKTFTSTGAFFNGLIADSINAKIYDGNDDLNKGVITLSNNKAAKNTASPLLNVKNVIKSLNGSQVSLSWSANPETDIAGYKVYYGGYTGYSYTSSVDAGNFLTYTLPAGVSIDDDIAVTAYDASKDGVDDQYDGNESWYSPANKIPESPSGLIIDVASKKIKLNWTASVSNGVNIYNVYRSTNGTTFSKVGSSVSTNFIDLGLTAHTKYYYKISALDSLDLSYDNYGLESSFSEIISASPNNITYVAKNGNDSNIGSKISPKLKISAAAIDASTGDSILINDGTYSDNINFANKSINFIGINGASKVILKPLLNSNIFYIDNAGNTLFKGLTFANGSAQSAGSAIAEKLSSPIIESCIFKDNKAGGGIIITYAGTFTMNNCVAYGNSPDTFFELSNSVSSPPSINHFTYVDNTGNLFNSGNPNQVANFKNSILWGNSNIVYSGTISVENSIFRGGLPGSTSNIDASPRFVDSLSNDYRLLNYSPAIGLGRSILGINTDIAGIARPMPLDSNPDAGAHESLYDLPSPYVLLDSSKNGQIYFKLTQLGIENFKTINIYKGLASGPTTKYQSIKPNTTITDTLNQEFNKPIYYRFSSIGSSNLESGFSNEIKTIAFTPPKLKAPLNLTLKIDTNITFSWSKIDNASLYTIQFSTDSTFSTDVTEKIVADTLFTKNNLTHNSKYYWRVSSSNGKAYSKWSSKFNFKTFISPPKLITVNPGNKIDTLLWAINSNKNIKYVKIYRDILPNPTLLIDSISGKLNLYIDKTDLKLNQKYYYRIVAGNFENEESEYSNVLTATPFNLNPLVKKFENKTFNDVGEYNFIRATYSSYGSKDSDGLITKYEWFVNDSLVNSSETIFVNHYKQGTNKLMLRITDNDGGKDSTIAIISLVSFTKTFKGAFLGGITALGPNIIYAADSNFDPINGASISLVNRTGNTIFPLVVSSKIFTTPSVTADSSVFITSGSSLNGFNKTGAPLWPTIPLGGLSLVTPTIDSQFDRIYLGVSNKNFFAIDSKTGKVAWNIISDAPINASAVITGDRKLIFTSDQGTIYGFDIRTNIAQQSAKWQINLNEIITKSPAIDQNNNLILGTLSGKILKVKLNENGSVSTIWTSNLGNSIESSPVIDANGFIYIGTNSGDFYRINPENGEVIWKYQSGYSIKSTPAISEFGNIYFANVKGIITALDLNKVVKWKYNAESSISAHILYIKNMVYAGTETGNFFGIYDNPNTNTLNAGISTGKNDNSINYLIENKIIASIKSENSTIIFNEQTGGLGKFNTGISKQMGGINDLPRTSEIVNKEPVWGTFQGNYRRTGSKAFDCPTNTITYSGSLVFCEGNSIVLTASEGISYLWSTGESSKTITINKAGDYSVMVTNLNGCETSSQIVSVKTITSPQVSLNVDGSTSLVQGSSVKILSTVNTDVTYQWYKDDVLIPGAVGNTLLASQSGAYKLRASNTSGCFTFSSPIIVTSLFSISSTNYKISIFGESCSKNNDGKISITAAQPFTYKATLMKGQTVITTSNFKGFLNFEKLPADKYSLCFTIDGQPDYKQCFDIVISEPKDLSVYSYLNPNNILKLALSGGSTYRISLNGEIFTTNSNTYNLGLKNGMNKVLVMTDKDCQGVFQEEVYVNEKVLVYPNPFTDILNIKINQEDNLNIRVNVYDGAGFRVYQAIHALQNGTIQLDLSKLASGYYSIIIGKDVYKVLKK